MHIAHTRTCIGQHNIHAHAHCTLTQTILCTLHTHIKLTADTAVVAETIVGAAANTTRLAASPPEGDVLVVAAAGDMDSTVALEISPSYQQIFDT